MTETYRPDYSTFGGRIYNYDFEGYNSLADIAARIESDKKFDRTCELNAKGRKKKEEYRKCGKCRKDLFK